MEMKKLIEILEIGQKSSQILRTLILQHYPSDDNHEDYYNEFDHHSMVVLDTFINSICMLKSCEFDGVFVKDRKLENHLDDHYVFTLDNNPSNSQESSKMSKNGSGIRRECFKKRKIGGELREEVVTHLSNDGFVWRKYGQKMIRKSDHPRQYYRCTHKQEQNCEAIKKIQQISDNPIKYKLIYHGIHTCNNNNNIFFKTSPYMMASQEELSSSIVLSFDGSNQVNPLLFPVSRSLADTSNQTIANDNIPEITNVLSSTNHVSEQSDEQISVGVAEIFSSSTTSPVSVEENTTGFSCYDIAEFFDLLPDSWTD